MIDFPVALPRDLVAANQQYKIDTEEIAAWLAENAVKCGYEATPSAPSSVLSRPSTPDTLPAGDIQLDDAPTNADTNSDAPTAGTSSNYKVRMCDFVSIAFAISHHSPRIPVPEHIDEKFNRAIDSRRRCIEWYEDHSKEEVLKNHRHKHFAQVLERT
ncbi:hypothetical protein F5Y04DRAFT_99486 [Hypomontagnella monticulosa]|nr:hypothetical protein F5Y04DRAFT_99486 [Hypomontagnella monticulosa]